jgi:putative inorganic carbon (hco3(-)) transporter
MRLAMLGTVVAALAFTALVKPRIGLFGYIWFAIMRPDVLAWAEDQYPFSTVLAIATVIGSLLKSPRFAALLASPISRWLLALQVPLFLSYVSASYPSLAQEPYFAFAKMMAVLFLIPILIRTENDLKRLILVIALSLGVLGARAGLWGLIHGGVVLVDGYGGMLSDNNLFALGIAMGVPLCWYGRQLTGSVAVRFLLTIMCCFSAAAVIMTNSRGGSLALGAVLLLVVKRTQRRLASLALVLLTVVGTAYLIRDEYLPRMLTMQRPTEEGSAASRLIHARVAFELWKDHPVLGVGFGGLNYSVLAEQHSKGEVQGHVAHNSYLQMLADSGIFAFIIYVGLVVGAVIWLGVSAKNSKTVIVRAIRYGLQTALVGFMIGGAFYSSQRYDLTYVLLLCSAALQTILTENQKQGEEACIEDDLQPQLAEGIAG